jgi:hypothetical protein
MFGSLLIADTVDSTGDSTGGQGVKFPDGDWAAVATLRKFYALRLQSGVCNIFFQFMNEVKKSMHVYKAYNK